MPMDCDGECEFCPEMDEEEGICQKEGDGKV